MRFYADAEEVLAAIPRRGVSMILRGIKKNGKDNAITKPFAFSSMQHIVQRMRPAVILYA